MSSQTTRYQFKEDLKEMREIENQMLDMIRSLNDSVTRVSINVAEQTQVLQSYKEVQEIQLEHIIKELNRNTKDIDILKDDVNKAKGIAHGVKVIWAVFSAIAGAVGLFVVEHFIKR